MMVGSKSQGIAQAFLKEVRQHFEVNDDLIRVFGDMQNKKQWNDTQFTVNTRTIIKKEATMTALGASGAVVSKHFDVIIADDLVGFENARTESQRVKLKEWFYSALSPTLEPEGEMHILGTRYHPLDLYQNFIDSGNYHVQIQMSINKFDESKKSHRTWRDKGIIPAELKQGEEFSLWADKFDLPTVQKIRIESGSIIFGMQYQNDVELAKGNIYKPEYFRHFDGYTITESNEVYVTYRDREGQSHKKKVKVYMGIDLAVSQQSSADYFVLMVIGLDDEKNIFILDYVKERLTFDAQFTKIMQYGYDKFPMVERIGIETNAYQLAMAQELRRSSTLPLINIKTVRDKISRALRRSALFENGKVFFRDNMQDLEETLLLFPEVEHDDLFDGMDFAMTVAEQGGQARVLDRGAFRI
jgi:predicted phage terminase large subunit-like protein